MDLFWVKITYQTILQGFNTSILKDAKKKNFIPYNISPGHYNLANPKHAGQKASTMLEYRLLEGQF
jgi:hypothetical protein